MHWFVLQAEKAWMAGCIAIQQECIVAGRAAGGKIVSQYKIVL